MNKKNWSLVVIIIIAIILGVIIGTLAFEYTNGQNKDIEKSQEELENENTIEISSTNSVSTNSSEEKVLVTTKIILLDKYLECNHEEEEEIENNSKYINMTKEEILEEFSGYYIKEFSEEEVILYRESEGICQNHYILKEENDKIYIYALLNNKEEYLYNITNIETQHLTQIDKENLQEGIEVIGEQNLSSALEDFE